MTHDEHFHSLTSINRILTLNVIVSSRRTSQNIILFIRIKRAKSGGRHRKNITVFDTKYLLIFR